MTEPNQPNHLPSYSGDHEANQQPELDFGAFDVNASASASGTNALRYHGTQLATYQSTGAFGDGVTPHPMNDPAANGWYHTTGTGKLRVFESLGWGFKTAYGNAGTWLVLGFLYALAMTLGTIVNMNEGVVGLLQVVAFFALPVLIAAALQQTLVQDFSLKDISAKNYGRTLGMIVVIGLLAMVILIPLLILFGVLMFAFADLTEIMGGSSGMEFSSGWTVGFAVFTVLMLLVSLLVAPFFGMQVFFAADNDGTFGDAFKSGFAVAKRNYGKMLGMYLLVGLLTGGMSVYQNEPSWLGVIGLVWGTLLAPPALLAMAYAYRQVSGGPVPKAEVAQPLEGPVA